MPNQTVVLFYKDKSKGVRIFKNPPSLAELQKEGDILVNPSLPKGIPPHEWKLINGKIKPKFKIESAKPVIKEIEPRVIRWFKPFTVGSITVLFCLEGLERKESISAFLNSIKDIIILGFNSI